MNKTIILIIENIIMLGGFAIIMTCIFLLKKGTYMLPNTIKKFVKKIKKQILELRNKKINKAKDIVIDFDETYYKIIKPDGTEFFKKKPNPAERIKATSSTTLPYSKREILTPTEKQFWFILEEKCKPYTILICPKVRMEDFLNVTVSSKRYKTHEAYRNKIKSRHIDFILCDRNMKMLAGVELDDKSHLTKKAKEGDELKNAIFKSIGIPLYRIKTGTNYKTDIDIMLTDIFK